MLVRAKSFLSPGGTPHTVRNESDSDASAFVVHAPGAPMENFSHAAAALAIDRPPSMDAVLAIAQQESIELLAPIPDPQPRTTNGAHFLAKS